MKRFLAVIYLFTATISIHAEVSDESQPTEEEQNVIEQSLFERTIKKDIDTSDYYDLVAWCQALGIDSGGQISQLRSSLYKFYNVNSRSDKASKGPRKSSTIISIKSAKETEYFNVEQVDENMVQFTGDVLLEITEEDTKRAHTISADKVVFNEKLETITAIGNIKYVMDNAGEEEIFWGDSLTFTVSNWKGLIFRGETQRKEVLDGKEVIFYFGGDKIGRSGKNVIVLDKGKVSTGNLKDPDFSIKATKIWITGPMEWGLFNGLIYMGNVPIFYIPFYFKPGNDMIFNPAIGLKDDKGAFLQTTTYFIGQKNYSQSFSFFQVGNEDGEAYETETVGLYKYKIKKKKKDDSDFLKMMADVYSNYGGFAALEGSIDEAWEFKDLDIFAGMGMSMEQDSEFFPVMSTNSEISPVFHESYFFGQYIPLRWGSNLSFNIKDLIFEFGWFSDPYFKNDFMDDGFRDENFDWLNVLLTDLTSEQEVSETTRDLSSYKWRLSYQGLNGGKIPLDAVSPYIQTFSVTNLETSILFNYAHNNNVTDTALPSQYFTYPSQVIFPNIGLQLKGNLLHLPYTPRVKKSKSKKTDDDSSLSEESSKDESAEDIPDQETTGEETIDQENIDQDNIDQDNIDQENIEKENLDMESRKLPVESMFPPWGDIKDKDDDEILITEGMILADLRKDRKTNTITPYSLDIDYALTPTFLMQVDNAFNRYESPEDIKVNMDPFLLKMNGKFSLSVKATFLDEMFSISNDNSLNAAYSTHKDIMSSGEEIDDSQYISDYSNTDFSWENDASISIRPLKFFGPFSNTTLSYDLASTIYQIKYTGLEEYQDNGLTLTDVNRPIYELNWGKWDEDYIKDHNTKFLLQFNPEYLNIKSTLRVFLPPQSMKETIDSSINLDIGPWHTGLSNTITHLHEPEGEELEWDYGDFSFNTSLKFFENKLTFYQSADFSTEDLVFSRLESNISAWGFQCKYIMEYTEKVSWDKTASSYIADTEKQLLPKSLYFGYTLNEISTPRFWKNRMYISGNLNTSWSMDLLRPSNNTLRFGFKIKFHIFKFLDLEFSASSINRYMYLYFQGWRDYLGLEGDYDNIFLDFAKSFNFFDPQDRTDSHFNLERFDLSLIHHLRDWDLTLSWTGEMEQIDNKWELIQSFSIGVTLNPIPKINTKALREYDKTDHVYNWSVDAGTDGE